MLKKMLFVVAVLLMLVSPSFAAFSTFHGSISDKVTRDDAGNITGWVPGYTPSSDRSVDWERDDKNMQRKAEVWNWPASYDEIPICTINVRMEVGFWIRLDGCQNQNLDLKQIEIAKYQGQIGCTAKTNVATVWSASFAKKDGIDLGGYEVDYCFVDPSAFAATSSKAVTVKLGLKGVNLQNLTPTGSCLNIGTVTVKVKPDVRPNLFMSGCTPGSSGANFGQANYQWYAPPQP